MYEPTFHQRPGVAARVERARSTPWRLPIHLFHGTPFRETPRCIPSMTFRWRRYVHTNPRKLSPGRSLRLLCPLACYSFSTSMGSRAEFVVNFVDLFPRLCARPPSFSSVPPNFVSFVSVCGCAVTRSIFTMYCCSADSFILVVCISSSLSKLTCLPVMFDHCTRMRLVTMVRSWS